MPNDKEKWFYDFDPEGSGYDDESAHEAGMVPDSTGHMQSRVPSGIKEGLILKGRGHKTFHLTEEGEAKAGYEIFKSKDGRYYSREKRGKGM